MKYILAILALLIPVSALAQSNTAVITIHSFGQMPKTVIVQTLRPVVPVQTYYTPKVTMPSTIQQLSTPRPMIQTTPVIHRPIVPMYAPVWTGFEWTQPMTMQYGF